MPPGARGLRSDAAANQERLLAAAVTSYLRQGAQVPMAAIASEAGVGVATLYRRYPSREALLADLTRRAFGLLADRATDAAAGPGSGLDRLGAYWDRMIDDWDQLVLPLHGGPPELSPAAVAEQRRLHGQVEEILAAGHADLSLRAEVSVRDLIVLGAVLLRPLPGITDWPATARRLRQVQLAGLAGPGAGPPLRE